MVRHVVSAKKNQSDDEREKNTYKQGVLID